MRRQLRECFATLSAMSCLLGFVLATPLISPIAHADQLGNGYNVTCTGSGSQANCVVSGCPRVYEDEAGDSVHARFNSQPQQEIGKSCNDAINVSTQLVDSSVDASKGFTFSIQGCRKHKASSDDCGAWSTYTYTPPAAAAAPAPGPAANAPVPNAQKPVLCEGVGIEPPGTDCSKVTPVHCPAGSASSTVPPGQQCAAPTNAVAMNITRSGLNAHAAITNNSNLPAKCSYTAKLTGGFGPQEVDKSIDVAANSTGTITDMLWPPFGTSYNAVASCTVTYNGKQTSIGQSTQNVSG